MNMQKICPHKDLLSAHAQATVQRRKGHLYTLAEQSEGDDAPAAFNASNGAAFERAKNRVSGGHGHK